MIISAAATTIWIHLHRHHRDRLVLLRRCCVVALVSVQVLETD